MTGLSSMLTTGAQLLLSAGVVGFITTLLTIRSNKRTLAAQVEKNEADAADVLTGTALRLLPPLEAQVQHFQKQVKELQGEVARLTTLLQTERAVSEARINEMAGQVGTLKTERDELRSQILSFTRRQPG